jgi:hypothetical protein
MAAPQIGRRFRKTERRAPILRGKSTYAVKTNTPKVTDWIVKRKPDLWGIGPGPWYWQGERASRPEYITMIVLHKLGWNPSFQTNILGGRRLPGGQVLDIVLNEHQPPVYISVKGYYHEGARASYYDSVKEIMVRSVIKGVQVLEVWEKDIDQRGWLEAYLRREVGVRGR